jgi:acyl-CoA-binding protein
MGKPPLGAALALALGAGIGFFTSSRARRREKSKAATRDGGDGGDGGGETDAAFGSAYATARSRAQAALLSAFDADLDAAFAAASDRFGRANLKRVPKDDKLRAYALYKQATRGRCVGAKPRVLTDGTTKHAKWCAWEKLGDMPSDEAKGAYVELVDALLGEEEEAAGDERGGGGTEDDADDGGFGGPVFSRPAAVVDAPDADDDDASAASAPSPLIRHVKNGDLDSVQLMLGFARASADADEDESVVDVVNRVDARGCTALHHAADGDKIDIAEALIDAGANINARDDDGATPLHYACVVELPGMCALLLSKGAEVGIPDDDGETAASLGCFELSQRHMEKVMAEFMAEEATKDRVDYLDIAAKFEADLARKKTDEEIV